MDISLILDNREGQLSELLPDAEIEQLDIGDILFRNGDETVLVIERKSVADLGASICDGRAREQKARLLNTGIHRDRVMFLVEGNLNKTLDKKVGSLPVGTLFGSMINTQFRDGVRVWRTSSLSETAEFVKKLHQKLCADYKEFWKYNEGCEMSAGNYSASLKKSKKANMTPEVWLIAQLSLIPQTTEKVAVEIVKLYPSVYALVRTYESFSEEDRESLLEDITYVTSSGKKRRIGPTLSSRIYRFIYGLA
jgi:crossover junction endonuclease MUS81